MTLQRRELAARRGSLGTRRWPCSADRLRADQRRRVPAKARVLVVGGGYGGATAAKYVRLFSEQKIDVVLVEPNDAFVSCPISNLVLGGSRTLADVTTPYASAGQQAWRARGEGHGGQHRPGEEDRRAGLGRRRIALRQAGPVARRRPDVGQRAGLRAAQGEGRILQAWKAGPETVALRKQLEAMPDGGIYAITDSRSALPLPARAVRARLPGGELLQGGQAEAARC